MKPDPTGLTLFASGVERMLEEALAQGVTDLSDLASEDAAGDYSALYEEGDDGEAQAQA